MIEAFPLQFPVGYERTKYPKDGRFNTTFSAARDAIVHEIKLLGGKNTIISSNVPLRRDGLPYANTKAISDSGVAVYFTYNNEQVVFACDKWRKIEDNMQAIRKAIEAIRGLERWGVSDMLKRTFEGFKALPEKSSGTYGDSWWNVLGVTPSATSDEIKTAYRNEVKKHHPDNGGSSEAFGKIQKAYDEAVNAINAR